MFFDLNYWGFTISQSDWDNMPYDRIYKYWQRMKTTQQEERKSMPKSSGFSAGKKR
jgi:hypothetical protein